MKNIVTKKCPSCNIEKEKSEFYKNRNYVSSYCKDCQKKKYKLWASNNRDKVNETQRRFKNKRPEYFQNKKFKKYGITIEDYEKMFLKQNGKCAICGEQGKLVVDHDHNTGTVRGLLCNKCNTSLGLANDDERILRRMIDYISKKFL